MLSDFSRQNCQICGCTAHGKHYDAITCRACAAFFRRSQMSKVVKKCKKEGKCVFYQNGFFNCKYCRLQKCLEVGMTTDGFQLERDPLPPAEIVPSVSNFLGKPNFIIFCRSDKTSGKHKNFIDVQFLIDNAMNVLKQGSESPIHITNRLKKLGIGLNLVRQSRHILNPLKVDKVGRKELLYHWEQDVLQMAKWLTYFDDFRILPEIQQVRMLKGIWKMWSRLESLAIVAQEIRRNSAEHEKLEKNCVIYDWNKTKLDMTWCSDRTIDELKFFVDQLRTELRFDELTQAMFELNPSDEELSFMICQLCFHYVGKRYQGDILDVAEKFQDNISNDLHDYYVGIKRPYYSKRLSQMMKINNHIQNDVFRSRSKIELAIVFDIFNVRCSHPELFFD